jgi:hypothetical protein
MERAAQALAPREHEKGGFISYFISCFRIFVFSWLAFYFMDSPDAPRLNQMLII